MTPNSSEFETILVDLSKVNGWKNNLTVNSLRLDPIDAGEAGKISFDYIYLMEDDVLSSSNQQVREVQAMVYPNPVNKGQDVTLQLSNIDNHQFGHVVVYDLQGRAVINRALELTESTIIPTNQLTKGLYIVHLKIGDAIERFKLIVN